MAILRAKDIEKMSKNEIEEKIGELRVELTKTRVGKKTGKISQKELRRTIARLLTFAKNKRLKGGQKADRITR